MNKLLRAILLSLTLGFSSGALLTAADVPIPAVRLPDVQPAPVPIPVPPPNTPTPLSTDQLFVIDADVSCIILASPSGFLSLQSDTGPLKIRGRFVDGTGIETRTYKGKYVYTVTAAGTGRCELLIVPAGALKDSDVYRRTLDVSGGPSPPTPIPPGPTPVPPSDPFPAALQAAYTADAAPGTATLLAALYRQAATLIATDTTLKTYGDLFTVLKKAQDMVVPPATIPKMRAAIGAELLKVFGSNATAPIDRDLTAKTLVRVATALEAVK